MYEEIGRLKVELDWLKKKLPESVGIRRGFVEHDHPQIEIKRQCELLGIHRSGVYYQAKSEAEVNLWLMKEIDVEHWL